MPLKNSIKIYVKNGIYHIYNRGVEKRAIFLDEQDYKVFLNLLKRYLLPFDKNDRFDRVGPCQIDRLDRVRPCWESELYKQIRLFCFCLMPNHFHLMIQQSSERAITEFMKRLTNAYVGYFNEKYNRKGMGPLFQGIYKAVLIKDESQFLYLPYYIHFHNPAELYKNENEESLIKKVQNYSWSSYGDYLGRCNTKWIYKKGIMEQFIEVEKMRPDIETIHRILGPVAIDY
ncbi:transposase [Patescibacteria group bacterium]|nr:transposase [Patescibacteria group bacterium]